MTALAVALLSLFFACAAPPALAAGEVVYPPGSDVGLAPPPGFTASREPPGFVDDAGKARIAITLWPATAYRQMVTRLTSGGQGGSSVHSSRPLRTKLGDGQLMHSSATGFGPDRKPVYHDTVVVLLKARDKTVMVTAGLVRGPGSDAKLAQLEAALLTLSIKGTGDLAIRKLKTQEEEALEKLTFTVAEPGAMNFAAAHKGGILLLDTGDYRPADSSTHQFLIIQHDPENALGGYASDPEGVSKLLELLLRYFRLDGLKASPAGPPALANAMVAERLSANGHRGDPYELVLWVRPVGKGSLRIVGVAPSRLGGKAFASFAAIARSVAPKVN